jgi:hypothetical protein
MKDFSEFHASGLFEESPNASFIALLSRIPGALDLEDFCSISFVGGIYKIIAKF